MKLLILIVALLILNIPVYRWLAKQFFDDREDFKACIRHMLQPDFTSFFSAQYFGDKIREWRAEAYLCICLLVLALEVFAIQKVSEYFEIVIF